MEFGSGIFLKKVLGHQIRDGFVNKNFNFRIIKQDSNCHKKCVRLKIIVKILFDYISMTGGIVF